MAGESKQLTDYSEVEVEIDIPSSSKGSNNREQNPEKLQQSDANNFKNRQSNISRINSEELNSLLNDSNMVKQNPSANENGEKLEPLDPHQSHEEHLEDTYVKAQDKLIKAQYLKSLNRKRSKAKEIRSLDETQSNRNGSTNVQQGEMDSQSNEKKNLEKPLQTDEQSFGSLDLLLKSETDRKPYAKKGETKDRRGSSQSVEEEVFIRKSDLSGLVSSEDILKGSQTNDAKSADSKKSVQEELQGDTKVKSGEKQQEAKDQQVSHEEQLSSKEYSSDHCRGELHTEPSDRSIDRLLEFEESELLCESNDMTESSENQPSEILTIEPDLEDPRSDSEESLDVDSPRRSKCFLLAYVLMGFFSNYQRTTIRTANLDFIYNVQTTMPRIHPGRKYIGQLLVVEYMAELFEDSLTGQLGISTMRKLYISQCISLFGYLMLLYADTTSQLLWGVGTIILSMSMSFNSMIDHLQLFDVKAAKAYNIGLQFAHLIAPGAYSLLSSVLEPKAQWWPFIVIPFLDVAVFYLLLRPRELKKYEELAPNYLKTENRNSNFLIEKFCGTYSILGPFALTSCLQLYTNQGLFTFLVYNSKREPTNVNRFRWYNTIFRLGHFGGASLAFFVWTAHTWPLPWLSFMNLATFMAAVLTDIHMEGLVVLILWDGFLSGFGEMCALKAVRLFGHTGSGSAALELRLMRKLRKIAGLICAIALTLTNELLIVSLS